jgi:hypothetical protein
MAILEIGSNVDDLTGKTGFWGSKFGNDED